MDTGLGKHLGAGPGAAITVDSGSQRVTWTDLAAVVAAEDPVIGARLTAWIAHPGAPELHLEHLRVVGGALDADLMQSNPVSFAGEVELGVWRGTKLASTTDLLAVHRVAFAAGSTHVTFRVPREGDTVDVDPLVRLPRRLPPDNWWGNGLRVNLHEVP